MKKIFLLILISIPFVSKAQRTLGLLQYDAGVYDGYTLIDAAFCPSSICPGTFLINNCGDVVHQWPTTIQPGLTAYFLPNGNLLRTKQILHPLINGGGRGGGIELYDFDGNLLWDYLLSNPTEVQHHDALLMPNGNILALYWSYKDSLSSYNNGRDPLNLSSNGIWSEKLVEIQPIFPDSGIIVWEWDLWDHLLQNRDSMLSNYDSIVHPELFDINYLGWSNGVADWLHMNAIDYNETLDQIVMSSRNLHEVYIIDHSTSTAEAASHIGGNSGKGGDILFRWGNIEAYGKGTISDKKLHAQHNVQWIADSLTDAGKLMVFNNGAARTVDINDQYSSVDVIDPMPDSFGNYLLNPNGVFGPDSAEWSYIAPNPTDFFSLYIGGAERLPNGNTIICDGTSGTIFEINTNKDIVWKYVSPITQTSILSQGDTIPSFVADGTTNWVFRAQKFGVDYSAFIGKTLTNMGPIELNPTPSICDSATDIENYKVEEIGFVYPNPTSDIVTINLINTKEIFSYTLTTLEGRVVKQANNVNINNIKIDLTNESKGVYLLKINQKNTNQFYKIVRQ